MITNLATIIGGPCLISYRGSTFRSKGDVKLDPTIDTFTIENDLYGPVDTRAGNQLVKVSFTPEGRFANLAVLFPYNLAALGSLITPRHECGAVDATADTIAVADTSLAVGTPISFGTTDTMPTGLTAATLYYLGADVAGVRKIYTTSADAIAATSPINITAVGSGTLAFIEQWPLVILGVDGTRFTGHNSAVTKMPEIDFQSQATLWGEVEFECFAKSGIARTTDNSVFTIDTATFADSGFAPADIITQPYSLTWGNAPWAGVYTKNGIKVSPSLNLTEVVDDLSGLLSRRISSLAFTAKATPIGPNLSAMLTALAMQGATAIRGRSMAGTALNIEGTGVYARLYAAALTGGQALWSSKADRIGELSWTANRTFTAGVANPLFYIGAAAPA